jgi:serine/threonine-protein kinase
VGLSLPKLTDFGLQPQHDTGVLYLSPEQVAGKPAGPRSDLYALGVVLYQMLTGRPPFEDSTGYLAHKIRHSQPERPIRVVPDLPPDLDELVRQLLEKDPASRPGSVLAVQRSLERLVGKQESKPTAVTTEEPARLMSRLMRQELETQKRGGPVKRLFSRPLVVIPLFLFCLGLLIWLLWPAGPGTLFARGSALMQSDNPDDWDRAWDDYLEPLQRKYPDYRKAEVAEFKRKVDGARLARRAERAVRFLDPPSEAQRFYQHGLWLRQQGKEADARRVWEDLIEAFAEVPAEKPWVRLARERLADNGDGKRDWTTLHEAVRQAKTLRREGKEEEAKKILDTLEALYAGDQAGREEIARELAKE